MLTAIRSLQRQLARKLTKRLGDTTWRGDRREGGEEKGGGEEVALIKSNNPHLAGGEQCFSHIAPSSAMCPSHASVILRSVPGRPLPGRYDQELHV